MKNVATYPASGAPIRRPKNNRITHAANGSSAATTSKRAGNGMRKDQGHADRLNLRFAICDLRLRAGCTVASIANRKLQIANLMALLLSRLHSDVGKHLDLR